MSPVERKIRVEGGQGELVAFDGKLVLCHLDRAFAPGAPMRIEARDGRGVLVVEGRSIGSKRLSEGSDGARFEVRLRMINFSRDRRERLKALLSETESRQIDS